MQTMFDNKLLKGACLHTLSLYISLQCHLIYFFLPLPTLVTLWFHFFFLEHATTKRFSMTVVWSKNYQQTVPFIIALPTHYCETFLFLKIIIDTWKGVNFLFVYKNISFLIKLLFFSKLLFFAWKNPFVYLTIIF